MLRYFLFLSFSIISSLTAQSSNCLILEKPSELRILNKFEQTLGPSESLKLYPFMSFEIIHDRVLMSDRITTAIKVKSGETMYFLLSDANGQPIHISAAGSWKMYYGVHTLSDTIVILKDDEIALQTGIAPQQSEIRFLKKDEKALRLFSWNGWTYLYVFHEHSAGWTQLGSRGTSWNTGNTAKANRITLSDVESNIQDVIDRTNSLLKDIYAALNRIEQRNETPPHWELKREKNKLICALVPDSARVAFTESTKSLKQEFENNLIGMPFKVLQRGLVIEIHAP